MVEQDGGKGPYASVPISAFSAWLQHTVTSTSGQHAPSPPAPAYYLSEMDDIDELCPALLPDVSFLRPFDAVLPWGAFIPRPLSALVPSPASSSRVCVCNCVCVCARARARVCVRVCVSVRVRV